jgi:hypothetical protein
MIATEAQDPLDELERENGVTEKLVERLAATAIELEQGRNLPSGEIAEGLRLLEQYRSVHARRFDRDLQSEAQPVAMNTCFPYLGEIMHDHRTEAERIERSRKALEEFTRDPQGARTRLAQALSDLTEKDHQSMVDENDYPLSCLRTALPDEAAVRLTAAFHQTASDIADLEGHIERYLEHVPETPPHALKVHCQQANCAATTESNVVPSNDGRLGIEVPPGWQTISRPPVFGRDGTILLRVEFCCPAHSEERPANENKPVVTSMEEETFAPLGADAEDLEPCGCCDPVPEDLR